MAKNESVAIFYRVLRERQAALIESLNYLIKTVTAENRGAKIEAARGAVKRLEQLKAVLTKKDQPAWCSGLEHALNRFAHEAANNNEIGKYLLDELIVWLPQVKDQSWSYIDESDEGIEFEPIYRECYRNSKVPELFDQLIAHIEEIVENGAVDSVQAIRALETLIATIRKNARGDFFSTRGTWEFVQAFFKNYGMTVLEKAPVIGSGVVALKKTLADLDLEFAEVHRGIAKKIQRVARDAWPVANGEEPKMPMLDYTPRLLPPPKSNDDIDPPAERP